MNRRLVYMLSSAFNAAPNRIVSEPSKMSRAAYLLFMFNKKLV